jgi:hypothetical protein
MILEENEYVEHFGTKGMHWGVRKERRAAKKAAKKEAMAKADAEYSKAVGDLVAGAAKRGNFVAMQVNNRTQIMTGKEAVDMIIKNNGRIPRNAMWNELESAGK